MYHIQYVVAVCPSIRQDVDVFAVCSRVCVSAVIGRSVATATLGSISAAW